MTNTEEKPQESITVLHNNGSKEKEETALFNNIWD
jgi:hypothetical protein